ncbi:MAG: hypothetical protein JO104_06910, partial [Candidatus Eremiobacteraeota bacterium]|nr:hypothetical protein [Candidatus Eremiobacteraeota bacterium]
LACSGLQPPIAVQRGAGFGSWFSPAAKSDDLLYVSDQLFNNVYVFSYPALEPLETLTGFNFPEGLCSDTRGNVFITDLLAQRIIEYAHGGSKPIATLSGSGYPQGCSVDPVTGNLAVADYGSSGSPGNVAVFHRARGRPVLHIDPNMISFGNCGYDDSGNLFADGQKYGNAPGLVELALHGSKLKDVELRKSFDGEGSVQWDGRHLAIMGNSARSILRLSIVRYKGTIVGRTIIRSPKFSFSFSIQSGSLVLTYIPHHSKDTALGLWAYPRGGAPAKTLRQLVGIYGLTVSLARRHGPARL